MVLAAGRGERLRPLTDEMPKPLIDVGGKPLIVRHLETLGRAGVQQVVVNLSWLGDRIRAALGDGSDFGVSIEYSDEGPVALETGGGIFLVLDRLGPEPFIVVNGDIYTDYEYSRLPAEPAGLAHVVLVPNPDHNEQGDFGFDGDFVVDERPAAWTFSGIGVYRPELFAGCSAGAFPLAPLLRKAMRQQQVSGIVHEGVWSDIGTIHRLEEVR